MITLARLLLSSSTCGRKLRIKYCLAINQQDKGLSKTLRLFVFREICRLLYERKVTIMNEIICMTLFGLLIVAIGAFWAIGNMLATAAAKLFKRLIKSRNQEHHHIYRYEDEED